MSHNVRRFPFAHMLNQILHRLLAVALLLGSAKAAGAQMAQVAEGSRVQISTTTSKKVSGTVKTVTADSTTLFIENGGGTRKFANADVTELRVSRGRQMSEGAKRGALWGSAVGAVLGAVIISTDGANKDSYYAPNNTGIMSSMVAGGLFWGVIIGAFAKSEQWDNVVIQPRVTSSSGGMGLSVAFSPSFLH